MTNIQAIDLLKGLEQSLDDYCELNDEGKTAFHMAITALEVFGNSEQLPSAQPERKGKWVGVGYDGDWLKTMCKCSKCGAMIDINEKYRNFFCYHCGARMDGEQDG